MSNNSTKKFKRGKYRSWGKECFLNKDDHSPALPGTEKFTPLLIQEPEDPFFTACQNLIEPKTRQITLSL